MIFMRDDMWLQLIRANIMSLLEQTPLHGQQDIISARVGKESLEDQILFVLNFCFVVEMLSAVRLKPFISCMSNMTLRKSHQANLSSSWNFLIHIISPLTCESSCTSFVGIPPISLTVNSPLLVVANSFNQGEVYPTAESSPSSGLDMDFNQLMIVHTLFPGFRTPVTFVS
jgi:hypothetical protein